MVHDVTKAELKCYRQSSSAVCLLELLKAASRHVLICYNAISAGSEDKDERKEASWLLHQTMEGVGCRHVCMRRCLLQNNNNNKEKPKKTLVRMKPWQQFAVTF